MQSAEPNYVYYYDRANVRALAGTLMRLGIPWDVIREIAGHAYRKMFIMNVDTAMIQARDIRGKIALKFVAWPGTLHIQLDIKVNGSMTAGMDVAQPKIDIYNAEIAQHPFGPCHIEISYSENTYLGGDTIIDIYEDGKLFSTRSYFVIKFV